MTPNQTQLLLPFLLALVGALIAVGCSLLVMLAWRARCAAARGLAAASAMGQRLAAAERRLETTARQAAEQARRVAWLESRMRQSKPVGEPLAAAKPANTSQPGITERRHRVLALARRGMEAEQIAVTLGVPYGEVELIISLNSLSTAA